MKEPFQEPLKDFQDLRTLEMFPLDVRSEILLPEVPLVLVFCHFEEGTFSGATEGFTGF